VSTFIFLFFSLIYQWGQWVSPSIELQNNLLLFIPNAAFGTIFPAASAALLFAFFAYRKKAIGPVAVILTAVVIYAVLFLGFKVSSSLQKNMENYAFQPFNEKKLHVTDNDVIYIDSISEIDSDIADDIIIRSRNSENPGFRYYRSGRLTDNAQPSLNIDSGQTVRINPANPVFSDAFKPDRLLYSYLQDMGSLNKALYNSAITGGLEMALIVAVLTAFLLSCLLFRGSTVWPLFEFVLILSFHRVVYYLFGLFSREANFISEAFFGGTQLQHIPLITLSGLTLIVFLVGLLTKLTSGRKRR
jgi:hypothetical protein